MSEIKHSKLPFQVGDHAIMSPDGIVVYIPSFVPSLAPKISEDIEFIVEACNNYYKLKEQNEKLKEQIRQTEAWLSFNPHPDKDQIRVFRNSMIELLKSCES